MTLFHHVVDRGAKKRGRNGEQRLFPLSSLLDCYECARRDEHISYGASAAAVPPFGCTFSSAHGQQNCLAVANEEGFVTIFNTGEKQSSVLKEWQAHDNAVFDIAWVPGTNCLVTASGDQTARLWDVITGDLLGTFKGHQCSLKSVAFYKQEKAVFSTGGRDGNIMIWDTRCSKKDGFYRQVKQISGAHMKPERFTPQTKKRRGMAPPVDSQQGVTVVLFCDETKLISSGAVDGIIKMWDLRRNYTAYHQNPLPLQAYPYPGSCTRKLGYSGLSLDYTGSRLFSNCTDDNIYMFNISGLKTTPIAVFSGHSSSSFYVKSTVSPDDQFLASGSSDHNVYIWRISDPKQAPMMLQGHSQEVTSVAWCPTDFTKIASCSDDNTVRIWRLNRKPEGENSTIQDGNLVGWTIRKVQSPNRTPGHHSPVELTPSKNPGSVRSVSLASPQPATCAPTGAALPLPSNTSSAPPAKLTSPKMPSSLQQWISRSSKSPVRKALTPVLQGLSFERRVKRRLETGDSASSGLGEEIDGVSELYPNVKRSRSSVSTLKKEDSFGLESEKRQGSDGAEASGKENSSPRRTDWLSVISQKFKGSAQPKSPSSGSSQQDTRTLESPAAVSPRPMKVFSPPTNKKASPSKPMKKISSYFMKRTQD
ncbi:denticleless protein homolog [Danio rerio]|uniref:denticleless protein homolog n=1 Tax=Danio rerio TaxID=7955 RepID=UPI00000FC58C|nr:denticleless protein homolog [Danio rerio]AAM34656.1 denticles-like protein [Danio rerio]|eukprot:NP_775348.1 denticleless protein homolog [Danio rerio]